MGPPPRKTLSAALVADRYSLQREIARGGMGTVWLAKDDKLGRAVAIKIMVQELARMSEALQRFEREAMALAGLRSAHVVQVYDYGIQEGLPYIVMELLEGENLGQRLKRVNRIGVAECNRILSQMCKGLKAAHGANLIHRDLKPSNIFIARRDDAEVVKLLDFGVVKALDGLKDSEATVTGILLGTPQYMSPEQARATRHIDHRSDLWALAVIAFRMLTGDNPFRGESVGDVVLKICSDKLPRIADHANDLPPALDAFFERAFQRAPDARFQAAHEMAAAFDEICTRLQEEAQRPLVPVPSPAPSHPGPMSMTAPLPFGVVTATAPHAAIAEVPPSHRGPATMQPPTQPLPAALPAARLPAMPSFPGQSGGFPAGQPNHGQPNHGQPNHGQPSNPSLGSNPMLGSHPGLAAARPAVPSHPAIVGNLSSVPPARGSNPALGPIPGMVTGMAPGMMGPAIDQLPVFEATPVSTTVGGTQLAPKFSWTPRPIGGQGVALIVGGAAALITVGLVVAVWLGGSSGDAAPTSAGSSSPFTDVASNDDDGPDDVLPDPADPAMDVPVAPARVDDKASGTPPSASQNSAEPRSPDSKGTQPKNTTEPKPGATPKPEVKPPDPKPEPEPARKKKKGQPEPGRPDWGLDGDG